MNKKNAFSCVFLLAFMTSCNSNPITPTPVILATLTPIPPTATQLPPTPMIGCIIKGDLRVRSEPNTQSTTLGELKEDTCVNLYGTNVDHTWGAISYEDLSGWVSLDFLTIQGDRADLPVVAIPPSKSESVNAPTPIKVITKTKVPPPIIPQRTNTPYLIPTESVLSCSYTASRVGDFVSCKIQYAYCSYEPGVSGSPTFCNDAPYPGNNFTLLVWGEDWSDYNGKCIIVSGLVTMYRGKPQIEATSRSQVESCR